MYQKDYYQILGVSPTASQAEIKKIYRDQVKKYHPDVTKGDKAKEEKFKDISEAYGVIGDEKKRKEYDQFRSNPFAGMGGGNGGRGRGRAYNQQGGWGPFEYSSYTGAGGGGAEFDDLGDIFGDIFGGMRGGPGRQRAARAQAGEDMQHKLQIDFKDAVLGTTIKVSLPHLGRGEKLNVKIPPGVNTGSKIRLAGKGKPGMSGGPAGDLYIEVEVKDHAYFTRKGDDLYVEVPITLNEAVQGAQIEVPTIDGKAKMKLPPGVQSGQKLRLKGKGVENLKHKTHGDEYIVLQIHLPKNLGEDAKKWIEKFEQENPYQPRAGLFL